MEPILNLFDCFTEETTAGEVRSHLEATGQQIKNDGAGNLVVVGNAGYDNPVLETRRQRALAVLGDRYLLHPANRIQRDVITISARGGK